MLRNLFKKSSTITNAIWFRKLGIDGIIIHQHNDGEPLLNDLLPAYLSQLLDDELAIHNNDAAHIDWNSFYQAQQMPGYENLSEIFSLPEFTSLTPSLHSKNSLADSDFSISIGWIHSSNNSAVYPDIDGAVLTQNQKPEIMRPEHWALFSEVITFSRRTTEERSDKPQREAWGKIRSLGLAANAHFDDFLYRCVVLTPERLDVQFKKTEIAGDKVVEIIPGFTGAPLDWLDRFDNSCDVQDRYDIVTPEGIVQVLIAAQVKQVLQEIKRLPSRRMAGSRAQAFMLNPYSTLGPDTHAVIDEAQFEAARAEANLYCDNFVPVFERDALDFPKRVGLLIESTNTQSSAVSDTHWLTDDELFLFTQKLEQALTNNFQLLAWNGYDLELLGNTPQHLSELQAALELRQQPQAVVNYAQVHDLSFYSPRIEGIGIEKPYFSAYIAKKKDAEGWFPENVLPLITFTPEGDTEPYAIPATKDVLTKLQAAVAKAETTGQHEINAPWLPKPISVAEAKNITQTFDQVFNELNNKTFKPENLTAKASEPIATKKTLILRANIETLDYNEQRRTALNTQTAPVEIPNSLNSSVALLPHQQEGLAKLQHLYRLQTECQVRGILLADDMGLGKTFQLLAFMTWLVEQTPNIAPMLVVAPVSLLENWKEETSKFIKPNLLPILTAYGDNLKHLRVPRDSVDKKLRNEDGLIKFLKPGWVGQAKMVLTTYETLRDLEFSFAAERWSVMICDEAQRIKNPAAMVTRSAKKQNVAFKIACTGTPVENTLADLWCLFDFVQPGLLGALNEFGKKYRRPIEAQTDEEKACVEELREQIKPQILRRLKKDVAKDLPEKIIVEECKSLPISNVQRNLYAKAIEDFKKRNAPNASSPFKNHLGLLQYLRLICTDPRQHGLTTSQESLVDYRKKAPKLDWLISQLEKIRQKNEKAIIFCEFKEIQRLLKRHLDDTFKIQTDIINGDTSVSSSSVDSRQKRIKKFQELAGFSVIILSPVAVGFGVNIQAANHVIHYTRTWNPAKEDQATDRAYRIGQKKNVYVYYPVVIAEDFSTFDLKLDQLLQAKRELADDMLNGSGDISGNDFGLDVIPPADADEIYKIGLINLDKALQLNGRYFEALAAALWSKQGYRVCYCTPSSNDHGVDAVAISNDNGVLIQAKSSSTEGKQLGWDAVKEVVAGELFYARQHPNVLFKKIAITNQFFNGTARDQAALNQVELIDQTGLGALLQRYPISMIELEKLLYSDLIIIDSE